MSELEEGAEVPAFSKVPTSEGTEVSSGDLGRAVLFF